MNKRHPNLSAFTLVELLVVVGIIAVLIAMLMPAITKARAQATRIACQSNMRQIYNGFLAYTIEYKDFLPPASASGQDSANAGWFFPWYSRNFIGKYLGNRSRSSTGIQDASPLVAGAATNMVFYCPGRHGVSQDTNLCYGFNNQPSNLFNSTRFSRFKSPYKVALVVDMWLGSTWGDASGYKLSPDDGTQYPTHLHHQGFCNVLFADGHVGDTFFKDGHSTAAKDTGLWGAVAKKEIMTAAWWK